MRRPSFFPPEISFLIRIFFAWLVAFSLLRLGLLLRNISLADGVPSGILMQSFVVGVRFDIVIASYLLLPLLLWTLIPYYGWQYKAKSINFLPWGMSLFWSPLFLLGLAEWEFYREFHDRFNELAIQYLLDDRSTVISMIWNGYPVIPYLFLWLVLTAFMGYGLHLQAKKISAQSAFQWNTYIRKILPFGLFFAILLSFGSRGGFQSGAPLRWGDAYFSNNIFANQLALNGIFTLGRTVLERNFQTRSKFWAGMFSEEEAVLTAGKLLNQPGDRIISEGKYTFLRYPGSTGRTLTFEHPPKHVVLILMESFSGEFVSAMGSAYGVTPNFDRIARKGILFDRFFSQGTHTHQGLFATLIGFPNLPGFEYLMKSNQGQRPFRSFISLLHEEGFQSVYVYNGSFTWDNQEGFFRNQGMKYFVGRDDFRNPKYMDATWGVSDEDMFMRGLEEIRKLAIKGPAFALLQTVSNHAPFDLPPPAPFHDLKGPEQLLPRLSGLRYSDWALGQFFDNAEKEPWFEDTLFVILGDHGFAYESPKAAIDLSSYHVPLLVYYPREAKKGGRINHVVSSQVDVLPTVMGLMGIKAAQQSWGRDLLRLDPADQGWAVIKPSGSSQTVGFVRGSTLFVESPKISPSVYKFKLNPWTATKIQISKEFSAELSHNVHGYVQAGLKALLAPVATEAP